MNCLLIIRTHLLNPILESISQWKPLNKDR